MELEKIEEKKKGILQHLAKKRKGAILGFDSVNYLLVLIIFVGLGLVGMGALEGYRIVACKMELNDIATAAATYQNLRIDHTPIDDPGTLVNTGIIKASEAVDGAEHGKFLKKTDRWKGTGQCIDPWGKPYKISGQTVVSQGSVFTGQLSTDIDTTK
ncbi:hypothetical protein [Selenomonas ruminantium]|uniref:hypothetical protein n=1 Tax=Selenomonas ruminantium TaxID=971 RepID=UPI0026F083D6|nr:hypothetical protein [Selenomonas ruminantium]